MRTKIIALFAAAFVLALILLFRASRDASPHPVATEAVLSWAKRPGPAEPAPSSMPGTVREPLVDSLGEFASPQAEPYLVRAVQTFRFIEQVKRRFPEQSLERDLLDSLASKLFSNDYRYAARATGALDPEQAQVAYQKLKAQADGLPDHYEPLAVFTLAPGPAAPLLAESHARMMTNPNPAYRRVWEIVEQYDPYANQTDLWKDALFYAASHAMLNDWMRREMKLLETYTLPGADESFRQLAEQGFRDSVMEVLDHMTQAQAAYQEVFAERFRARGLDPELAEALKDLNMGDVGGRDFDIP